MPDMDGKMKAAIAAAIALYLERPAAQAERVDMFLRRGKGAGQWGRSREWSGRWGRYKSRAKLDGSVS